MAVTTPERYLADLNEAQRQAVTTTEGPLLVIAGAGSGKTRVLTYRIAHLIAACGVKPNEILAITFTNKAANEMRERLEGLLGDTRGLWVLTFHAACGRILRREAPRLGYRTNFTIYDQADQIRLTKACLEELEREPKRFVPRGIHAQISAATKRASACSSSTSITRTGSPSPSSDQRLFGLRSRLFSITAFADSRIVFVER